MYFCNYLLSSQNAIPKRSSTSVEFLAASLCRTGGLPRHPFTIRKNHLTHSFHRPCSRGDFPPIGERNGGALPYDSLFTLLLCDVLRTIWFPAHHSAECANAKPRGLCVTKRGQDHPHLLLRYTSCHSHRHDMGIEEMKK